MNAKELYDEALRNAQEGKISEALDTYTHLLDESRVMESLLTPVYNDLAVLFYQNGRIDKALEYFGRASELEPDTEDLKENFRLMKQEAKDILGVYRIEKNDRAPLESPVESRRAPAKFYSDTIVKEIGALIPDKAQQILDIGCGEGHLASIIRNKNKKARITGIELDKEAASRAEKILNRVFVADASTIDLICPDGFFDCIVYDGILEHVQEPLKMLKNYRPYLAENGTVVAVVPNVQHFSVILDLLQGKWTYKSEGVIHNAHLRFFTHHELKLLFKEAGYSIDEIKGHDVYPLPEKYKELIGRARALNLLSENFDTESISYYYTISAHKVRSVPKEELFSISYSSERMIPGKSDWKVELQHQLRYNFLAPLSRGKKALDAGCGEGYGAYAISGYAQSATAIERDQETFIHAQSLYKRENLDFRKGDLLAMDLQGTYDCIYSLGVIEQADDAEIVLSRLKEALETEGILVLSTSNKRISSPDSAMPANPFHKMEWTAVELEKLLCSYFDHVILLGQSDEGIRPVTDMTATRDPHFIALCSRKPVTGLFEKLQDEWNQKKTSIVVVSCNSLEVVKQCTAALIRYTYHPYEIIAVDNASKDGSADYLKTVANTLIQRKENIGYWGACMEGIVSTSSPYVALLHSDVVVSHNWLGKLLEPLQKSPEAAITGPFSNRAPDTQKHKVIYENVEEFLKYARVVEMEHFGCFRPADTLSDFCMVLKREALQKAGFSRLEMPANQKKLFKAVRKAGLYLALKEDTFVHHKDK